MTTIKRSIDRSEWWPVYELRDAGEGHVDVTLDVGLVGRYTEAKRAFENVQRELDLVYAMASLRAKFERELALDVAFVQKHRPWWTNERCVALVHARQRSGRPLRQRVPLG